MADWLHEFADTDDTYMLFVPEGNASPEMTRALHLLVENDLEQFIEFCQPECATNGYKSLAEAYNLTIRRRVQLATGQLLCFEQADTFLPEWHLLSNAHEKLHRLSMELSTETDPSEFYRKAIEAARNHFLIDRIGLLLLDDDHQEIIGTWGTDAEGNLTDESDFRGPIPDLPWVHKVLTERDYMYVKEGAELRQYGKKVGTGWSAMVALWDGQKCIGWLAADNLIHHRAIEHWQKEILAQFGRLMAQLISRRRSEDDIREINRNLERLVEERSQQLQEKIRLLESTQNELIETEKLAALGGLVAGVAHEINTPVGNSVTAASHIHELANTVQRAYADKTMKKSQLESFFSETVEGSEIVLMNLSRASELIASFKQLAVEQTNDILDTVELRRLVDNLFRSLHHEVKNRPITLHNDVPEDIKVTGYAGRFNQIFSNLVQNALLHGFPDDPADDPGNITITAELEDGLLNIDVRDNGIGVSPDKLPLIFDPFYTTRRKSGGTGLGLNIIHNLIKKMHGSIEAHNLSPHGLMFQIRIPVEGMSDV